MKTFNLDEIFLIDKGFYGWCLDIIREIIPSVYESDTLQNNFTNYMLKPIWRKYQFTNANYNNNERGIDQFKNDFANQLQDVCVEFYSYVKANISHFEGLDKKQDIFKQVNSVVAPINATINQTENDTEIASGTTAQNINTTLLNDSVWLNIFNTYMSPQRKGEMLNRFNWLFILSYYDEGLKDEYILEVDENLSMAEGNQVIEFDVDNDVSSVKVTINKPVTMKPDNIKEGVNIGGVLGSYRGRDVSDATASSGDILLGKVAYGVNYQRIVGTIPTYDYEGGEDVGGIVPVGTINITENGNYDVTQYAQANVNVSSSGEDNPIQYLIDNNYNAPSCRYLFANWGGEDLTNVLKDVDTSQVKNFDRMFNYCMSLKIVPLFDTSNGTDFYGMFEGCPNSSFDKDTLPLFNLSNATNVSSMFSGCRRLKSIPLYDTQNVTNMNGMFNNCERLTEIPLLNTSKVTDMSNMFSGCSDLTTIPQLDTSNVTTMNWMFDGCTSLKSILMYGMKVKFSISASTKFETEDLVTILNNLAIVTKTRTLTMGSTNLAKLSDEQKQIAINKGWTLA